MCQSGLMVVVITHSLDCSHDDRAVFILLLPWFLHSLCSIIHCSLVATTDNNTAITPEWLRPSENAHLVKSSAVLHTECNVLDSIAVSGEVSSHLLIPWEQS